MVESISPTVTITSSDLFNSGKAGDKEESMIASINSKNGVVIDEKVQPNKTTLAETKGDPKLKV